MNRDALMAQLRIDEDEKLQAYQDSLGYWTIGVGRLIDRRRGGGISSAESTLLLNNDVTEKYTTLSAALPWLSTLDDVRQNVLLNMAFNLGVGGLMGFHHMLAAVQTQEWALAATEMLDSEWAHEVGARATRLAEEMKNGQFNS